MRTFYLPLSTGALFRSGQNSKCLGFAGLLLMGLLAQPALGASCKEVTMTGNAEYPPVTWKDLSGNLVGSYVEFTQRVFNRLGIPSTAIVTGNWQRSQQEVKTGRVDMLLGPWYTDDRTNWLEFVYPHISLDPAAIFVNKSNPFPFNKLTDLSEYRGVIQRGNKFGDSIDKYFASNDRITWVNSWDNAFRMLGIGRGDYIAHGLYAGKLEVLKHGLSNKITTLPHHLTEDQMFIAFSKLSECKRLIDKMKPIIEQFKKENLFDELTEKYMQVYTKEVKTVNTK